MGDGRTSTSIAIYFARGESTVGRVVTETTHTDLIHMAIPTIDQLQIAEGFDSFWNLENCLSASNGKHVHIEKLPNLGSTNFNYKSFYSILLIACCYSDGTFTMIDTGHAGRNGDSK